MSSSLNMAILFIALLPLNLSAQETSHYCYTGYLPEIHKKLYQLNSILKTKLDANQESIRSAIIAKVNAKEFHRSNLKKMVTVSEDRTVLTSQLLSREVLLNKVKENSSGFNVVNFGNQSGTEILKRFNIHAFLSTGLFVTQGSQIAKKTSDFGNQFLNKYFEKIVLPLFTEVEGGYTVLEETEIWNAINRKFTHVFTEPSGSTTWYTVEEQLASASREILSKYFKSILGGRGLKGLNELNLDEMVTDYISTFMKDLSNQTLARCKRILEEVRTFIINAHFHPEMLRPYNFSYLDKRMERFGKVYRHILGTETSAAEDIILDAERIFKEIPKGNVPSIIPQGLWGKFFVMMSIFDLLTMETHDAALSSCNPLRISLEQSHPLSVLIRYEMFPDETALRLCQKLPSPLGFSNVDVDKITWVPKGCYLEKYYDSFLTDDSIEDFAAEFTMQYLLSR